MSPDSLKRLLRRIKKDEVDLCAGLGIHSPGSLVWNAFFSTSGNNNKRIKYPLASLQGLTDEQIQDIITEYLF